MGEIIYQKFDRMVKYGDEVEYCSHKAKYIMENFQSSDKIYLKFQ